MNKKLNRLFKKYGVTNRTNLISAIRNIAPTIRGHKNSTKLKELRIIKNESKENPNILKLLEKPLKQTKKAIEITKEFRNNKKKQYNASNVSEAKEELKASKVIQGYTEKNPSENNKISYEKVDFTIKVKTNQLNNGSTNSKPTNDFSIGLRKYEKEKIDSFKTNREKVAFLNNFLTGKIFGNQNRYKHLTGEDISITSIEGIYQGGVF